MTLEEKLEKKKNELNSYSPNHDGWGIDTFSIGFNILLPLVIELTEALEKWPTQNMAQFSLIQTKALKSLDNFLVRGRDD